MSAQAVTLRKKVDTNAPELNRKQRRALEKRVGRKGQVKQYHLGSQEVAGQFALKAHNERTARENARNAVHFGGTAEVPKATQ